MRLFIKKFLSVLMVFLLAAGLFFPQTPVFAAPNTTFSPTFTYDPQSGRWIVEWMPIDGTSTVSVRWHKPDGSEGVQTDVSLWPVDGKHRISLELLADHIYDLRFSFKNSSGGTVSFRDKYNAQVTEDTVYFLPDITFEGTSFNDMAVLGGLTDRSPELVMSDDGSQVIRVISGQQPKITFRWKVPTIWEPSKGQVLHITHKDVDLNRLESGASPHVDIDFSYFHIKMNVVRDVVTTKDYRTGYSNTGGIIVRETGDEVSGFDAEGGAPQEYVSFTLDHTDGILPGTEYEKINIRLFFWNEAMNEQAISSRLVYGSDTVQGFPIENKDNIFNSVQGSITSLFTPMMYEVSKVDVDKIEIRIYKIKSRNYTELYYQVQDAGTIVELLEGGANTNAGIKVPDASIPSGTGWGSVIVEIPLTQNGQHPEHYYRVVVTDGNSHTPLGSLAIDLRILGNDTGKPPVPKEVRVEPEYALKKDVTYYNNRAEGETIRIPTTNLRISFEKPLLWMGREWGDIQAEPDNDNDFTFHILLNTYLSDDVKLMETKVIGDQKVTVFAPVKEKRVLTFDKHDLQEDPADSTRLVFEMDGTALFRDLAADKPLDFENNEDMDVNGRADYPTFLLPNTMYYLRMFSARRKDSEDVNWAAKTGLGDRISYISPVVSFTTYPNRDLPVPLPNLELDVDIADQPDPVTGKPVFRGITVKFPKILDDNDWLDYTRVTNNRKIVYDLYISDRPDENSFILLQPPFLQPLQTLYPDENPDAGMSALIDRFPVGQGEALKPNTTYYFKMQAKLYVNNEDAPFLISDETPIKSVTTPKTDSGSMDDLDRKPRTPVEFSIARNDKNEEELTDAKVTLTWKHYESDVTYEMVVTKVRLDEGYDYTKDDYHIGDLVTPGFLDVYKNYKPDPLDKELHIDVLTTPLKSIGFTYNTENTRMARFPVNLPYLRPNHLYYFNLRAVRNRGQENAAYSDWVSIPVTTKMVAPPDFLEPVHDVQIGFKVKQYNNISSDSFRIMLKKSYQTISEYIELDRSRYSVVKDGSDYYIRLYDLDPGTWYDIKPYYVSGNVRYWYDSSDGTWNLNEGRPVKMNTRDTLHEIEVRFAGESLYDYYLELRTDDDAEYTPLRFNVTGESDYGYDIGDGTRIEFYREKIAAYLVNGMEDKYVYYAKISNVTVRRSDGTTRREPLRSNTRYYVKAWARHIEDSIHIGPVTVRTDFSQDDYDREHFQDELTRLYNSRADGLTRKLYFTVNEPDKTVNRVLLKGAMISSLLKASGFTGVTVDISAEKPGVAKDTVLIPMEVLETLQKTNARLTIRVSEGELTLTGETINPDTLKKAASANGVKEAMLELTIERKPSVTVPPPEGLELGSRVFDISMRAVGTRLTYAEINDILYKILKDPKATGPFKYGILDREFEKLLREKTTLTYRSQADLSTVIDRIIDIIEEELSLYLRDILDGGRGFTASRISGKDMAKLDGDMKLKILHDGYEGLAEPMVLPSGASKWQEPAGVKAWMFPYVLVNCKAAGQYAVFTVKAVTIPQQDGLIDPELQKFSRKYNLQKVFGGQNLYPGDFVSKDSAVNLFEVIIAAGNETAGLSTPAKIKYYQLEEILPTTGPKANINRQQAVGLVVEIYAYKTGVPVKNMRPTTMRYIKNAASMSDPVYNRLVIALDLGITGLESDGSYRGESPVTVEEILREVITVLDLLGEW